MNKGVAPRQFYMSCTGLSVLPSLVSANTFPWHSGNRCAGLEPRHQPQGLLTKPKLTLAIVLLRQAVSRRSGLQAGSV